MPSVNSGKSRKKVAALAALDDEDDTVAMETDVPQTPARNQNQNMTGEPMEQDVAPTPSVSRHFNAAEFGEVEIPPAPESVATYDVNGPRLMISQIKNHNFKSYAGTQTLGPFHKSFTSIVGPNGSGKSNVIDSMLFVFGYRANKIRSKKLSVLLHNSQEHQNITSCTVSVYFQKIIDTGPGDDEFTVVPNSEIVVSRTANKDNTSNYSVNGRKVTYKEVAALLRRSGIDLDHNRFLILQGEVEQIAMMKPKAQSEHEDGMLEFLEDIIGSNRFKEPIDILSKRVETLNEFRAEKLNRVKVVEKEKDDLEGPKNEAVEFLKQENSLTTIKHQLYHVYIQECVENEEKASEEHGKIKESLKEVDDRLTEITNTKKSHADEHKKVFKEFQELQKETEKNKETFNEFEQKDVKFRDDLKHTKSRIKKLDATQNGEKKKIEELKAVPEQSEKLVEELQVKQAKLEVDKKKEEESMKKVMDSLKTETKGLQEEKEVKETKVLEMCKSVNDVKSTYQVAQSELDVYLSNQTREQNKLNEVSEKLETAQTTLKQRKENIADMEKRIPDLEKIVTKCRKDFKQVEEKEAQSTQQVRELREKLEVSRSSMQADMNKGKVIKALMDQKRQGKIPGIYGRLGDLGGIDKQYDVAISTACGALDNIVVDTINTAQKCVNYLKQADVGVATFIALDKMARFKEQAARKIQTPENVPRLFDLVKVNDDDILPAFYYALRDTLVAKDLDQATKISYGKTRYRVVTLQGQVIDIAGTLSGGGNSVCKGRMGSAAVANVDPRQLVEIEKSLEKATVQTEEFRENRDRLEEMIRVQERDLKTLETNMVNYKNEIQAMKDQIPGLTQLVKTQEEKVKEVAPDPNELKNLEKKVAKFKADYDKISAGYTKLQDEVKSLNDKIMEIGGSKIKAVQSKLDAVSKEIDQTIGNITKTKVSVKTAERNLKKAEDKLESTIEEIQENKDKMAELEKAFEQMEKDAMEVLQKYEDSQGKMKEVEVIINGIKRKMVELEDEETKLQKDNIDVRYQLDKYENLVKENKSKTKHWKKEISKLSLSPIDGEEISELQPPTEDTVKSLKKDQLTYTITVMEENIRQLKPNMASITEYRKKEEVYLKRVAELDEITDVRDKQRRYHEDLRKQRLDEFMAGFNVITNKLKEMYQMITLGGDAELELLDSLDPFSEGIVFSVRPPRKSWKNISNLSGGEKTLSSLALVFALHHYKPTPLYVMDEIDAALDFKNVSIIANYIKERTRNAQFIIISLRSNMFELADRLVGIYKTYDCTKSVTINPNKLSLGTVNMLSNMAASGDAPTSDQTAVVLEKITEESRVDDVFDQPVPEEVVG